MSDDKRMYKVYVSGHVECSAEIEVEADSEEEAREQIQEQLDNGEQMPWSANDYITEQVSVDEVEDVTAG